MREKGERPPPRPSGWNCCHIDGFSLHANTRVAPLDRKRLEQLAKHLCRPAILADRLALLPNNEVRVRLKTPWRDGTEAIRYTAQLFLPRLAAIILLPRRPAVMRHGAFAPNQLWRANVVRAGEHAPKRRRAKQEPLDPTDPLSLAKLDTKLKAGHWVVFAAAPAASSLQVFGGGRLAGNWPRRENEHRASALWTDRCIQTC